MAINTKKFLLNGTATTMAALTLASAIPVFSTVQKANAEEPVSAAAAAECGNLNIALAVDYTWSFSDRELQVQLDQINEFLDKYSEIPGAKVDVYRFGTLSLKTEAQPEAHKVFDVSTPEGLAAAKAYVNEVNVETRSIYENDTALRELGTEPGWVTPWWSGTNWDSALTEILNSGIKYDNVVFSTDGSPNKWVDDETGAWVNSGSNQFSEEANAEAQATAKKIREAGMPVTPIFVQTSDNHLGGASTPEKAAMTTEAIKSLTGKDNARDGVDYYGSAVETLAESLFSSATATCPTDLGIVKTLTTPISSLAPGSTIEYELTVSNNGTWDEPNAVVKDIGGKMVDPSTVQISSPSKGTASGQDWTIGELKAGETVTAKVTAQVSANASSATDIVNTATVTGHRDPFNPNNPGNNSSTVTTKVTIDLKLAKKMEQTEVKEGDKLTWDITTKNDSESPATGVYVADNAETAKGLQDGTLKFVDGSFSKGELKTGADLVQMGAAQEADVKADAVYWFVGDMTPGEIATAKVEAVVAEGATSVENIATVSNVWDRFVPNADGSIQTNNDDVAQDEDNADLTNIVVTPKPINTDLKVDKALVSAVEDLTPGSDIEYKVTVKNDSESDDPNAVLTDVPDSNFVPGSIVITPDNDRGTVKDGVWTIGELKAGETVTATVKGKLTEEANIAEGIKNVVTVTGEHDPYDPNGPKKSNPNVDEDDDNYDESVVKSNSQVKVAKKLDQQVLKVGDKATWTITAKNSGADKATGVYVEDTEAGTKGIQNGTLKFVDGSATAGELKTGAELIEMGLKGDIKPEATYWYIGTLDADATHTIQVEGIVAEDAVDVENIATISDTWKPYAPNPDGSIQTNNDDVNKDEDQADKTTLKVEKPEPAPSVTPEPTPSQTTPPVAGEKTTPAPAPQGANTGEGLTASDGILAALGLGAILGGGALGVRSFRKKKAADTSDQA